MTDLEQREKALLDTFIGAYNAIHLRTKNGTLTGAHTLQLADIMAVCFRDYVTMQRAAVGAQQVIEKVKK